MISTTISALGWVPLLDNAAVLAQESSCTLLDVERILEVELASVLGEPIGLSTFPGGLQAVILANRSTSSQAREVASRLRLEFSRYEPFRRVIVIDGTKVATVQNWVLESLQQSATAPNAPILAVDFQGEPLIPLQDLVQQEIPDWDPSTQAILFILDGMGQVLSLHALDQSLEPARACLRQQVRQLNLQIVEGS